MAVVSGLIWGLAWTRSSERAAPMHTAGRCHAKRSPTPRVSGASEPPRLYQRARCSRRTERASSNLQPASLQDQLQSRHDAVRSWKWRRTFWLTWDPAEGEERLLTAATCPSSYRFVLGPRSGGIELNSLRTFEYSRWYYWFYSLRATQASFSCILIIGSCLTLYFYYNADICDI